MTFWSWVQRPNHYATKPHSRVQCCAVSVICRPRKLKRREKRKKQSYLDKMWVTVLHHMTIIYHVIRLSRLKKLTMLKSLIHANVNCVKQDIECRRETAQNWTTVIWWKTDDIAVVTLLQCCNSTIEQQQMSVHFDHAICSALSLDGNLDCATVTVVTSCRWVISNKSSVVCWRIPATQCQKQNMC